MTTRKTLNFKSGGDPFFIGFDALWSTIEQAGHKNQSNFPPYNIIRTQEYSYVIELAIAGFSYDQIKIIHEPENNLLKIESDKDWKSSGGYWDRLAKDEYEYQILHQGIAERNFTRTFTVSDDIVIKEAEMDDGILKIYLERIIPEEKKPRTISIKSGKQLLTED